jgi:uncharacterized membrane protein
MSRMTAARDCATTNSVNTMFNASVAARSGAGRVATAILFVVAGLMHFVVPRAYMAIVPPQMPSPALLVAISGVCEIAGGIGILMPSVRPVAGPSLIALLIVVFPANVQMLIDARARGASGTMQLVLLLRLPLQFVLAAWVRAATR